MMINIAKFIKGATPCIVDVDSIDCIYADTIQNGNQFDVMLLLKQVNKDIPLPVKEMNYGNAPTLEELDKLVFAINAARTSGGTINEYSINNKTIPN